MMFFYYVLIYMFIWIVWHYVFIYMYNDSDE